MCTDTTRQISFHFLSFAFKSSLDNATRKMEFINKFLVVQCISWKEALSWANMEENEMKKEWVVEETTKKKKENTTKQNTGYLGEKSIIKIWTFFQLFCSLFLIFWTRKIGFFLSSSTKWS